MRSSRPSKSAVQDAIDFQAPPTRSDRFQALVDGVDAVTVAMERKWGMGRLPLLVSDDLRTRWYRQWDHFTATLAAGDEAVMEACAPATIRGWQAMDASATGDQHPPMNPDVWEIDMGDGRVVGVVRDASEASVAASWARFHGRELWTLDEIKELIRAAGRTVGQAKQLFPGARVTKAVGDPLNDDIPI